MNKATHPVRKQYVDLLRFDHRGNFTNPIGRVDHRLSGSIRSGHIVRGAWLGGRLPSRDRLCALKRTLGAAFRTTDPGNLSTFGHRNHHVATFLVTLDTEFVDAFLNSKRLLFYYDFFAG